MQCDTVAVILAPGFEEIEAVTIIDVLRRAEIPVIVAGLEGKGPVTGSHAMSVGVDVALDSLRAEELAMVALPGGMPGSKNLAASAKVLALLKSVAASGGWTVAICAAPMALREAGLLEGRRMTVYPSMKDDFPKAKYVGGDVVVDGHVVTGSGAGTALRFSLALVEALGKPEVAASLRKGMLAL